MARTALVNLGDGLGGRMVAGKGDIILWIHGYTLNSECWSSLWDQLPGYRHIGIDLPGHGISLPLPASETMTALAGRLGRVARDQGARHLVALSFGAIIALQMALEHPGAVETLVLGSPLLGGGPFEPELWRRYKELKAMFRDRGSGPHLSESWMAPDSALFRGTDRYPRVWDGIRRQVRRHPWWELADDSYYDLWHQPQASSALRAVAAATLVLGGRDDGAAARQCSALLGRLLPACRQHELPDLGHLGLLEGTAHVLPLMREHWLANNGPQTGGPHACD